MKVISAVTIGKLIEAHMEHNEQKFLSYANFIAESYEEHGEERKARIIRKRLDGTYKNESQVTPDSIDGWIMANVNNDNYICDYRLKDYYGVILITYETLKKKRYSKAVLCNYGYISKQIGGEIIAWQFLPDSCKAENPYK